MADVKPEDQAPAARGRRAAQQQRGAAAKDPAGPGDPEGGGEPSAAASTAGEAPAATDWRVADAPLFIYHPEAGTAPVRAYNPGDRVSAELVNRHGWHDQTHVPEWASAPPAPAPDTTSSEEQT
jgi:hypothetical protein